MLFFHYAVDGVECAAATDVVDSGDVAAVEQSAAVVESDSNVANEEVIENWRSWLNEWLSWWLSKWMYEWMNEWMNEWMKEWMIVWLILFYAIVAFFWEMIKDLKKWFVELMFLFSSEYTCLFL